MTDLVITGTGVVAGSNPSIEHGIAGATFTAGKVAYFNQTTKRYGLADNNAATPPEAKTVRGIALNGASDGQPLAVLKAGEINLGVPLVAGTDYYLSDTPGGICPRADVIAGETVTLIGLAKSTSILLVSPVATGVTL